MRNRSTLRETAPMTAASLRSRSCRDLAQMARAQGVAGWHSMRKDELVRALLNHARKQRRGASRLRSKSTRLGGMFDAEPAVAPPAASQAQQRLSDLRMNLATNGRPGAKNGNGQTPAHDRLVVMVRDPYWLHAYWELAPQSIERAASALSQHWHTTRPVLRVYHVARDGSASLLREIAIHGGVNHWYVDVQDPPQQYRMEIGYATAAGQFYCLARSNTVATPPAGTSDAVDNNWADVDKNADRIFAMSGGYSPRGVSLELRELLEERLRRPMGSPMQTRYGRGASQGPANDEDLPLAVDAELVVYGVSHPQAHVTLHGEPVALRADGSFAVRMRLPERRQVIPVIASSPDGVEQRTVVLAIERNTKALGPVTRDPGA